MKKKITLKKTTGLFFILFGMLITVSAQVSAQCNANFTWMQTSNNVITFTNTSTGTNLNTWYDWSFGDGNYGYTQNPVHTYNIPGVYTACLYISDSSLFCSDSTCYTITVTGSVICNLTAIAYENTMASCGTCADGSANAYPAGGSAPYSYSWNTVPIQTTSYANGLLPGTYTVCITDVNACTACTTVTIDTSSCNADFTWVQSANNTITFTNTSNAGIFTSYHWFLGDGSNAYTANPVHYYTIPGTYLVCLSIQDTSVSCNDSICHIVAVTGVICNLSVTATSTNASCGVCTDGTASATASGGTPPYTYQWNTGANTSNITGLSPGNYFVCVTDANGCNQCAYVTVGPNVLGCAASFTLYADSVLPHTYWGMNTSTGTFGTVTYIWSWGDGTYDTTAYPTHTYATASVYMICLTLTDSTGCNSTYCDSMYLMRLTNSMITVNIIPSGTTGIKDNVITNTLPIFPNPAKDYVVVGNVSSKEKLISATIINSTGNIVATETMKNNTFNVSKIPPGVYFIKFLHPDGRYSSAKLVIMR
jgi:PKD repeat protein